MAALYLGQDKQSQARDWLSQFEARWRVRTSTRLGRRAEMLSYAQRLHRTQDFEHNASRGLHRVRCFRGQWKERHGEDKHSALGHRVHDTGRLGLWAFTKDKNRAPYASGVSSDT